MFTSDDAKLIYHLMNADNEHTARASEADWALPWRVPRPRFNLTRFHGVFAPNFKHRAPIVTRRARGRVNADKLPPFGDS